MGYSRGLFFLCTVLVMPSFGASLRMDVLGEVQVSESSEQPDSKVTAHIVAVESISFPHQFEIASGSDVLVFKNESTGKTVGLKCKHAAGGVEISPLLWRELSNDGLGEGSRFSWSFGSVTNNQVSTGAPWQVFEPDAVSLALVDMPTFKYKDNGSIKSTGTTNRTLVAVSKSFPVKWMTLPGADVSNPEVYGNKASYTYELPDGRLLSFVDGGQGTVPAKSLTVSVGGTLPCRIIYDDSPGEGFRDTTYGAQRRAAMEYAVGIWASKLFGTVPVEIYASLDPLDPGVLGGAGPMAWGTSEPEDTEFDHVDTVYVSSLVNQLLGSDFWPGTGDVGITFSSTYMNSFYFGTDGNCPNDKVDFVTVVLHELTHGLGFLDGMHPSGDGSYWVPDTPFVFDHSLYYSGNKVVDLSQTGRGTAITSGSLYWDGSNGKAANGGSQVRMYAPSTYNPGSSVSHWDYYVPFTTFMKHSYVTRVHTIDSRLLGALQDMEWMLGVSYNAWAVSESIPAGQRGELDTPAGDGIENIWKFAAGLDAMTWYPRSALYSSSLDPVEETFSITYKTAKFRPQVSIVSEWTDMLNHPGWESTGITTEKIGETDDQETWKTTIPMGDRGFIQLRVELD